MNNSDERRPHSSAKARRQRQMLTGVAAGVGVGLALVLGLFALLSDGPDVGTTAQTMPGGGVVAAANTPSQ